MGEVRETGGGQGTPLLLQRDQQPLELVTGKSKTDSRTMISSSEDDKYRGCLDQAGCDWVDAADPERRWELLVGRESHGEEVYEG